MKENRLRWPVGIIAAAASALISAGCASPGAPGGHHDVFTPGEGTSSVQPMHTLEITDVGIFPLQNISGSPVRLKSVTIASPLPGLHILNVRAYNYLETKGTLIGGAGDLPTMCPRQYKPHPAGSFVTPPHKRATWFIVVAFTISKPGRYNLRRLRIDYTTDGHDGWQYFEIDTTVVISNPPRPGPTPEPRSAECGF
jgi:hypothetical protein